jgi:acid phosphatase
MRSTHARSVSAGGALALLVLAACSAAPTLEPTPSGPAARPPIPHAVDALLWSETAEEARQLRRAVFASATRALEAAVEDRSWSALGQGPEATGRRGAVIVDVDETVLDNGPFEVRMAREGRRFDATVWEEWVAAAAAKPVPGALEFARRADELGVRVFYVTNRDAPEEEAGTLRNLEEAGFPLDTEVDTLLLRGERPEWRSDKTVRFAEIARDHRVLLLVGDDLNDFLSGVHEASLAERRARADAAADRFGTSWFLLPNPLYGSWLRALGDLESTGTEAEVRRRKLELLHAFEGIAPAPTP